MSGLYSMAFIERLTQISGAVSRGLRWVAGAGLMAMLLLTVADVIGIKLFKTPVPGAIEMVGFMGVVVVAFWLNQARGTKHMVEIGKREGLQVIVCDGKNVYKEK